MQGPTKGDGDASEERKLTLFKEWVEEMLQLYKHVDQLWLCLSAKMLKANL